MRYLVVLFLLAACTATGPSFNEGNLPKGNGATIVIYRPYAPLALAGYFDIDINGQKTCNLYPDGFFVRSGLYKDVTISSSIFDQPGTSRIVIPTKPKHVYYVSMEINNDKQMISVFSGLIGRLATEGSSSQSGPFIFTLVDEEKAKQDLSKLRLQTTCN